MLVSLHSSEKSRPLTLVLLLSTASRSPAMINGSSDKLTTHPSMPPMRAFTSPTFTDTTGRLQASDSLTAVGEASLDDVTSKASQADM